MFLEGIPVAEVPMPRSGVSSRALEAFVQFIERRLGGQFFIDARRIPYQRPELLDLFALAAKLQRASVINKFFPDDSLPDEPPLCSWSVELAGGGDPEYAAGAHGSDDRPALTAALAEALERHLWFEHRDYFDSPRQAAARDLAREAAILPERFAGFSAAQRAANRNLQFDEQSQFLWVKGYSWVANAPVWLPAQVVSGSRALEEERRARGEPLLRSNSTNGLATHGTREGAALYGALELIERDAYMVMWLNQLSLPRFDLAELCLRSDSLARLVARCRRYRLEPHALRLLTDAPTYVTAVVLEDAGAHPSPPITLGLRAGPSPAQTVEKALLEALRMRRVARRMQAQERDYGAEAKAVGHLDRLLYWMAAGRAEKLRFLTQGPVQHFTEPWEHDTEWEHLTRIIEWCRAKGYELASVSLGRSAANATPWQVEMVVIPELQPIHLSEKLPHIGGARLRETPTLFGYEPREPYLDDPHPFA